MVLSDDLQTNRYDPLFNSLNGSLAEADKSFVCAEGCKTNALKKSNDPDPSVDDELSDDNERPATVADQDQD